LEQRDRGTARRSIRTPFPKKFLVTLVSFVVKPFKPASVQARFVGEGVEARFVGKPLNPDRL
jgi:hypothetical protein